MFTENKKIVNNFISSFSAAGRGFGAPSVMEHLSIPRFNLNNKIHNKLSSFSQIAHNLVRKGKSIEKINDEIDSEVRTLWNIR